MLFRNARQVGLVWEALMGRLGRKGYLNGRKLRRYAFVLSYCSAIPVVGSDCEVLKEITDWFSVLDSVLRVVIGKS